MGGVRVRVSVRFRVRVSVRFRVVSVRNQSTHHQAIHGFALCYWGLLNDREAPPCKVRGLPKEFVCEDGHSDWRVPVIHSSGEFSI